MSKVIKRGRPNKFGAKETVQFKQIVREHGLIHGCEFINENGLEVDGVKVMVSITIPTLSKYVKKGRPVKLKRGRPNVAKVVNVEKVEKVA